MGKAQAIIYHYGSSVADFVIRASGKMEWNGPGPEPTEEQIEQWEVERIESLKLSEQKSKCIRLLNQSEIHCTSDPPYPDDVAEWIAYRKVLREILQSDELWDMPKKPF